MKKSIVAVILTLFCVVVLSLCGCSKEELTIVGNWKCYEVCVDLTSDNMQGWIKTGGLYTPEEAKITATVTFNEDGTYYHKFVSQGKVLEMSGAYELISSVSEMDRYNYTLYDSNGNEFSPFVVFSAEDDTIFSFEGFINGASLRFKRMS